MSFRSVKGVSYGVISGITWAIDTVLIGVLLANATFMSFSEILLVAPLVSTFLHDVFSAIWMTVYLGFKGELKVAASSFKRKNGRIVILAGALGGPIGMTCYVLALQNIGASYTAVISTVYPAVGAFFAYLILRDRLSLKNWFGLILSITFIILLSYTGELVVGTNVSIGLLFAIGCVIGWGMECVVSAYAMKDEGIEPEHALWIRQLSSAIIFGALVIPVFIGHSYTVQVIASGTTVLYLALISLAGTLSYVFYYKAINTLGPIRAMALNISYAAWAIVFSALLVGSWLSFKEMVFAAMILAGSLITVMEPSPPKVALKEKGQLHNESNNFSSWDGNSSQTPHK